MKIISAALDFIFKCNENNAEAAATDTDNDTGNVIVDNTENGSEKNAFLLQFPDKILSTHSIFSSNEHEMYMWGLDNCGVVINGEWHPRTTGKPETARRILHNYSGSLFHWCNEYDVPVEIAIATIATESSGMPTARREEPGYICERTTPHLVSSGVMQTLVSTARYILNDPGIDSKWLETPDNSIKAGVAYIGSQYNRTSYDPPAVAAAYNAGGVYANDSKDNRWGMRCYPIGTGEHIDRFVAWFNDAVAVTNEMLRSSK